jgi:hypothetical protein
MWRLLSMISYSTKELFLFFIGLYMAYFVYFTHYGWNLSFFMDLIAFSFLVVILNSILWLVETGYKR